LRFVSVLAIYSIGVSSVHTQSRSLVGQWQIEFKFSSSKEHTLRLDAHAGGNGTFLLLDSRSNLLPPAEPTKAQWEQAPSQVMFWGDIEFPIGNVGRDAGALVFNGAFESADAVSGKVAFFRVGQDPKDPATVPAKSGKFTARRGAAVQ